MASVVYLLVIAAVILSGVDSRTFSRFPRAIQEDASAAKSKDCYKSAPCGWAIYVPFTREVVDFMPNTCKCPDGLSCVRADDDLSVSAYVHRCRPVSKVSDPDENLQVVVP